MDDSVCGRYHTPKACRQLAESLPTATTSALSLKEHARMRTSRAATTRRIGLLAFLLGAVALAGCGSDRLALYDVTGKVLVDGQPAEGAIIIFYPVDASEQLAALRPAGKATASGDFELTTYEPADGAPAGQFKVLVKWPSPTPNADPRDARPGAANKGPDRLKGKYYNIDSTPLAATIEEQSNELAPFELTSK
jgi:hypothetical protein